MTRLINVKRVKQVIHEHNRTASAEFISALDYRVRELIYKAVRQSRHFKRLKASELL